MDNVLWFGSELNCLVIGFGFGFEGVVSRGNINN